MPRIMGLQIECLRRLDEFENLSRRGFGVLQSKFGRQPGKSGKRRNEIKISIEKGCRWCREV